MKHLFFKRSACNCSSSIEPPSGPMRLASGISWNHPLVSDGDTTTTWRPCTTKTWANTMKTPRIAPGHKVRLSSVASTKSRVSTCRNAPDELQAAATGSTGESLRTYRSFCRVEFALSSIRRTVCARAILSIGLASSSVPGCFRVPRVISLSP